MDTKKVKAKDLKVGDTIIAKQDRNYQLTIIEIEAGALGRRFPYLVLTLNGKKRIGHDTAFDGRFATYTVVVPEPPLVVCRECLKEYEVDELDDGLCYECLKEDCPTCEGTGDSDEYDEDEGILPCDDCGGDGRI